VYDLADAGPRHRFTVMTDAGPLIVHNCILGLQYGLGWQKFQKTVAMQSKAQVGQEVILSDEEAARVISIYRTTYHPIPKMWSRLNNLLPRMTGDMYEEIGPLVFLKGQIKLPSGLYLNYHELQNKEGQWWFTYGGKPKYLYGGKMLENIVQALARICVMDAAVRVRKRIGVQLHLQVHDELVYVVPDALASTVKQVVYEEMCTRPNWGVDIPLDAEGDIGESYGDAK
jgi:DNA polymerase bacteriophage-type